MQTVFDVNEGGKTLSNRQVFAEVRPGASDGFRIDEQGNMINVENPRQRRDFFFLNLIEFAIFRTSQLIRSSP